jgi:rhodanese-related sulfurtransferase
MNDSQPAKRKSLFLALLIVVAGLIPVASYWYWIGRGPGLEPQQAWEMLKKPGFSTALADVRTRKEFSAGHLEGAMSWPYSDIMALEQRESLPQAFSGKRLILICSGGVMDALAASHLRNTLAVDAYFVKGGMQGWIEHGDQPCGMVMLLKANSTDKASLPVRASSSFEEWALILSGFAMKPAYMILALVLIIILWRSSASDLVALRWSMIFFLAGEIACALNYLIFTDGSHLMEYLHSYGMVTGFGFAAFALLQGMDTRLIHLSDPGQKCAALGICRACIKYGVNPCRLKQMFYFLMPACAVLAAIPFSSAVKAVSYNTHIWGTLYNFSHSVLYQIYEIRYCPVAAIIFCLISFLALRFKKNDAIEWAKIFFSSAVGAMGFGLFRLVLFSLHSENQVWFSFWEETTELVFICGVCFTLWSFRKSLFEVRGQPTMSGICQTHF